MLERDERTVLASSLPMRAEERDLFDFFSSVGEVVDVRMILDRSTRRSRGMAFIEFATQEEATAALALTGAELKGQAVQVRASEAQKNAAWAAQQAVKAQQAPPADYPPGMGPPPAGMVIPPMPPLSGKLLVANIAPIVNEEQLRTLFASIGEIANVHFTPSPDGQIAGSATVTLSDPELSTTAIAQLNGLQIASRPLIVATAPSEAPPMPPPPMPMQINAAQANAADVQASATALAAEAVAKAKAAEKLEEVKDGAWLPAPTVPHTHAARAPKREGEEYIHVGPSCPPAGGSIHQ